MSGESRHRARLAAVLFPRNAGDVLLERRPESGDRFVGLWNGIGGHVEPGECIEAAARRELREETGLEAGALRLGGVIHESGLLGHDYVIFFFVAETASRELRPGAGVGELAWHSPDALDGLALVPDVGVLLPRLLAGGEPFFATERYAGGDIPVSLAIGGRELPLRSP